MLHSHKKHRLYQKYSILADELITGLVTRLVYNNREFMIHDALEEDAKALIHNQIVQKKKRTQQLAVSRRVFL